MKALTIIAAQTNPLVGDIQGNTDAVLSLARRYRHEDAPVVLVFPELNLTAYPPEDLLLRDSVQLRIERSLRCLCDELPPQLYVVVGFPERTPAGLCNVAAVIHQGAVIARYAKRLLPNYQVFDEKRYFVPGAGSCVVEIAGIPVALTVCEDVWESQPTLDARAAGARLMLNINASPFHIGKAAERVQVLGQRAREGDMPIVYVNQVGGQDELVFDGGSFALDAQGQLCMSAPSYASGTFEVHAVYDPVTAQCRLHSSIHSPPLERLPSIYQALQLGVRDYVDKNGFPGVVLGLSGGIDSALTLAIAVDALGADRVAAVMMPFRYTSRMSRDDAADQARRLGVRFSSIPIEAMYSAFIDALAPEFGDAPPDAAEENLQARCRGVLLMAISNKRRLLVLTTGNKSELAVGYSTLYGDMAGGFDVLKDVPKTLVFELARYRNGLGPAIPERVIERPPSAELRPDQKDEDSLPPYEELDAILQRYVEQDRSAAAIIADGFDADTVAKVIRLVDLNEYKRRQAPPGVRITQRGFGRDRRYPITSGWTLGD
jgi:NAD+ synthase (glutamine-hydrolysing)